MTVLPRIALWITEGPHCLQPQTTKQNKQKTPSYMCRGQHFGMAGGGHKCDQLLMTGPARQGRPRSSPALHSSFSCQRSCPTGPFQSQDGCPLCTCFCPGRQSVQPSSLSSSSYAMRAEKRESPVPSLPLAKESQTQTTPERERNHWGSGARGWVFNQNYWNSLSALTLLPIRSFSPLSVCLSTRCFLSTNNKPVHVHRGHSRYGSS